MGKKRKRKDNGNGHAGRDAGAQYGAGFQYGAAPQYGAGMAGGYAPNAGPDPTGGMSGSVPPGFGQGFGTGFGAGFGPSVGAGLGAPGPGPDAGLLQGMAAFLPTRNTEQFVMGLAIGAAMAWVLSDEELRGKLVKTGMKLYAGVVGGFEEMKEQMADIRAEVEAERNQDP